MAVTTGVRYARSGEFAIAYQVVGSGAVDLVIVPGTLDHIDTVWEQPGLVRFIDALTSFARVVLFDRRGMGLSDRASGDAFPTPAEQSDDVLAVMDAIGSARAVIVGTADGSPAAMTFAA